MTSSLAAPPTLRQLQEWMAARILPPAPDDALPGAATALDAWLDAPAPARTGDRLAVYRGGYPARIAEALADIYPAVARGLGEHELAALVDRYAAAVPLNSYNLNDAGAALPVFLCGDPASRDLAFLPDL